MLSLAPFSEAVNVMDPRFSSRGFDRQRQGPISDSPYLAIALERQIAYEGYKNNIDVFLGATGNNETYNINIPGIDITADPNYTYPLALPRTVISFKPGVPQSVIEETIAKLKKGTEVTKVNGVKGHANCYLVDRPTYPFLKFINTFVVRFAPKSEGYAQIGESMEAAKILHFIDLYLRTNTYPAFKNDEDIIRIPDGAILNMNAEKRPAFFTEEHLSKRIRYPSGVTMTHDSAPNKGKKEDGLWLGKESDAEVYYTAMDENVFHARPSPAKSSRASWSAPKDVPSLPGLCFPYFNGMITNDNRSLRYLPGEHFMRLFGSEPREQFLFYRQCVGGFASTSTGIIMSHILHGVDISLKTQTKLHLLFDGQTYLGFCILGAKWAIQRGTKWYTPKTSSELQADLGTIITHESSLSEVIDKLKEMGIDCDEECDGCDLAECLSKISWDRISDDDERKDTQRWFEERVGRLDFGTRPVHFGADTVVQMMKDIAEAPVEGLDNHVHFPPARDYALLKNVEAIALARFGYLVPSFVIDKGTQSVRISSLHADRAKGESARKMVSKVLIAMKPLAAAVRDFKQFRNTKHIFQMSGERASTYRLHTLGGDPKDRFLIGMGLIINAIKADSSSTSTNVGSTRVAETSSSVTVEEFAVVDVPDFF